MGKMKVEEKTTSADVFYIAPSEIAEFLPSAEEFASLVSAMAELKATGLPIDWTSFTKAVVDANNVTIPMAEELFHCEADEDGCGCDVHFHGAIALDDIEDEAALSAKLREIAPSMPEEVADEFASQMFADIDTHRDEADFVRIGTPDAFGIEDAVKDADVCKASDLIADLTLFARGQHLMLSAIENTPEVVDLVFGDID